MVLYLLNCALSSAIFAYRTLNTNKKVKYKNFLQEVGRSWISEVQNQSESISDDLQWPEKKITRRGPKHKTPGRLSGDFRIHKLKKIVAGGEGNKEVSPRQCKVCAAHKRSETRYACKFCVVPLHKGSSFEKYHSVKNYCTIYMQFLQSQAQELNLQCQPQVKVCYGVEQTQEF